MKSKTARIVASYRDVRWRLRMRCRRLGRAWAYFREKLTADDAQTILIDCTYPAGWHSLLVLTVDDVLDDAREMFEDHPELPQLAASVCARVARKWESCGDELDEARRWALDLVREFAAGSGIALVENQDTRTASEDLEQEADGGTP